MRKFVLVLLSSALLLTGADTVGAQGKATWAAGLQAADKAYWDAYNRADPDGMNKWLAADVEFYHDRGGKLIGKKALSAANEGMRKTGPRLRREAVPGSMRYYPMREGDAIYGAIVNGRHRFYERAAGGKETLVGEADFSHLVLLQGKEWRIARIFSFEHVDAPEPGK